MWCRLTVLTFTVTFSYMYFDKEMGKAQCTYLADEQYTKI